MKVNNLFLAAIIACISFAACTDSNTKQPTHDSLSASNDTAAAPSGNTVSSSTDTLNKGLPNQDTSKRMAKTDKKTPPADVLLRSRADGLWALPAAHRPRA